MHVVVGLSVNKGGKHGTRSEKLCKYWFKEDEYKLFCENNFNIFKEIKASGSEDKNDSGVQIQVEDKVELEAHDEVIKIHTTASSSEKRKQLEKPDGQQQSPIQQQTTARLENLESPCDSSMERVRPHKSARHTKHKMEEDDRSRMTRGQKRKIESQANKRRVQCKKNQVNRNKPNKKEKRKLADESDNSLEDETDGEDEPGNLIPKKIKIRARASTFSKVVTQLSKAQKEWIQNAGFGDLLLFWFPKGNRDVVFAADKEKLDAWRSQFPEKIAPHKVTEKMVFAAMKRTRDADIQFKQNFMVLLSNLFLRSHTGSYVNQEILEFVGSFDDALKFNWCKLVVKGLRDASIAWLPDPIEQYYTGSLVFLIYFYLEKVENDLVKAKKTRPSFIGWKNSIILQREATEDVDNSFGQGIIETMQLIEKELKQIETLQTSCRNNLKIARALFPSNPELEKLEEQFERLHQSSGIKKAPATVDHSCEHSDLENVKANINQMNVGQRPRREIKIGEFQKSPFRQRTIDIDKLKLSKAEEDTWSWLNANNYFPLQQIFSWNGHYICLKQQIQSLRDGCQLYTAVVDTSSCILNDDERFRSLDSPRRFFCNTYTTLNTMTRTNEINPPHDEKDPDCLSSSEMKYKRFCSNFNEVLAQFSVSIINVDLRDRYTGPDNSMLTKSFHQLLTPCEIRCS
ncbi:hypothetical protein ACET3Z_031275 [Daucus carota]